MISPGTQIAFGLHIVHGAHSNCSDIVNFSMEVAFCSFQTEIMYQQELRNFGLTIISFDFAVALRVIAGKLYNTVGASLSYSQSAG